MQVSCHDESGTIMGCETTKDEYVKGALWATGVIHCSPLFIFYFLTQSAAFVDDDGKVVHYKPGVYAIYVSTGGTEHDQEQELERRLAEEEEEEAADDDFIDDDLGHGSQNKSTNKQGALFEDEDDEM